MTIRATLRNNTLLLTADNESRAELADAFRNGGYHYAEHIVAEELHEKWEFIGASVIGALTDAPIVTKCDELYHNDDGDIIAVGKVAWFPDYMVRDPWAELRNCGRVAFTLSP